MTNIITTTITGIIASITIITTALATIGVTINGIITTITIGINLL